MNVREQLLLEYSSLDEGVSVAGQLCPACKGGSTGEGTLSVSKQQGHLLWNCHRASCGFKGRTGGFDSYSRQRVQPVDVRGAVGRTYVRGSRAVPAEIAAQLQQKYEIGSALISKWQVGWEEQEQRLVLPCFNHQKDLVGCVLRSLSGAVPKTLTHTESMAMAWYPKTGAKSLIIVEDQLSAMRASNYMSALALLGTNVSEDRAYEIKSTGYSNVYLALDRDAFALSVRYASRYRGILSMQVVPLQMDIKNMNEEQLNQLMETLNER